MSQPYHVSATSHWPNYLPEYIAADFGYFADEGLEFSRDAPEDWTGVLTNLAAGDADAVLGGLWVPAMYHGRGKRLVAFAQLNATNPKAILTRDRQPGFRLSDLQGKLVLAPGAGGTAPYTHTAGLIRQAGVDPASVDFVRDLSAPVLTELFIGGMGDAIIVDLVNAHLLEAAGVGHIAFRHAEQGGWMPNSVYYTVPEALQSTDSPAWPFTRAIQRAMDWLRDHTGNDCRDLLSRIWPQLPIAVLVESVDDLRKSHVWDSVRIGEQGFDTWMAILRSEHLTDHPIDYAELVHPGPADGALSSR